MPHSPFSIAPKKLIRVVLDEFRQSLPQLVGYEVLFRIISAILIVPATAWAFNALIAHSGSVAINNEQVAVFLLSPTGIISITLTAAVVLALFFAEQAGLYLIVACPTQGERLSPAVAIWQTVRMLPSLFRLGLLQFLGYVSAFLPFGIAAWTTYRLLLGEANINYYLAEKPAEFLWAVSIGCLLLLGYAAVAFLFYIWWIFSVPLLVFRKETARSSLKISRQLVRGCFSRIAKALLGWLMLITLITASVGWLLDVIDSTLLSFVGDRLAIVLPTVAGLVVVKGLATAVLTFLGLSVNCLLVFYFFRHLSDEPVGDVAAIASSEESPMRLPLGKTIWSAVLALLLLTTVSSVLIVNQIRVEDQVAVTAHRGSSLAAPENSLSAVRLAIEQGADYAEIDVQETSDGILAVIHDDDLMRITGVNRKIWEIDYSELKELDAGSWFSEEFADERIPTLEEVIDLAQGRIRLNIELKFNGHDARLAERVVEMIVKKEFVSQCVVTSLDYQGVKKAQELREELLVGLIATVSLGDVSKQNVDFISANMKQVNSSFVSRLKREGKDLHVWTVNDRAAMVSMIDLGVDNIITDDPGLLVSLLQERAELSTTERILLELKRHLAR